jgi:uncharacterized protein Yka (UPF0111/DUF47 family)
MTTLPSMSDEDASAAFAVIKEFERKGDIIEREVIRELNATFITSIDREDIHEIVVKTDKAMDGVYGLARRFEIYTLRTIPPEVIGFCEIMVDIAYELINLMKALQSRHGLAGIIDKMHTLENRGDDTLHQGLGNLFNHEEDPAHIIKFKEIFEMLEEVIDSIDHIGKIVRGILVKLG